MKYLEARITITPNTEEARDLLAALAADSGFESFTDSEDGLLAYIQADLFNEESMQQIFDDFPIRDVEFAYDISEVEDKNWNESWEQSGFDPIEVGDECIIYDAKDGMKSFPHNIAVGIEARRCNHRYQNQGETCARLWLRHWHLEHCGQEVRCRRCRCLRH